MAATKVGIVYATGSGILRRWIVPDNDSDLIRFHTVAGGETLLMVDAATIPADPAQAKVFVEAAITRVTGKAVASARCAVVDDDGNVIDVVMADPALDAVPDCTLVLHATADVGWSVSAGALAAPVAVKVGAGATVSTDGDGAVLGDADPVSDAAAEPAVDGSAA